MELWSLPIGLYTAIREVAVKTCAFYPGIHGSSHFMPHLKTDQASTSLTNSHVGAVGNCARHSLQRLTKNSDLLAESRA